MSALDGALLIVRERVRQVTDEGYQPERDEQYTGKQLAWAAYSYLFRAQSDNPANPDPPLPWPWAREHWKPGDRLRMLVKAGALIAAEIDRLLAEEKRQQ